MPFKISTAQYMASHACIVWLYDVIKLSPKFRCSGTTIVGLDLPIVPVLTRSRVFMVSMGHIKRNDHIPCITCDLLWVWLWKFKVSTAGYIAYVSTHAGTVNEL